LSPGKAPAAARHLGRSFIEGHHTTNCRGTPKQDRYQKGNVAKPTRPPVGANKTYRYIPMDIMVEMDTGPFVTGIPRQFQKCMESDKVVVNAAKSRFGFDNAV
jgi:hypothetical protein